MQSNESAMLSWQDQSWQTGNSPIIPQDGAQHEAPELLGLKGQANSTWESLAA